MAFADDCIGEPAAAAAAALPDGGVALLENLRFHAGEEKNDPGFARGARRPRRRPTSTTPSAPPTAPTPRSSACRRYLRAQGRRAADGARGRGARRSCSASRSGRSRRSSAAPRSRARSTPSRTCCRALDLLMVGGGMANTFLAAQGYDLKASLRRARPADARRADPRSAPAARGTEVLLPTDLVVADSFDEPAARRDRRGGGRFRDGMLALDVGPRTRLAFAEAVARAQHAVLERPAGRLREAAVRRRHARRGARRWPPAPASP